MAVVAIAASIAAPTNIHFQRNPLKCWRKDFLFSQI